ncbi:MAG: TaqI-like C-terminal specificity domain-containing protein [Elusimicrobiales bacterium]|nr:TaqI-like C-terminal specificity domain-containing protein [Elusimicrobiales bacterium]
MKYQTREEKISRLRELTARFQSHLAEYKNKDYKEAKLRHDFLNPFFELLDWDIYNESGKSEDYRDVIVEDSLEVSGSRKAPDYCFKIGKERKFYVEAKKPSVDIKHEVEPSLQVRRYGHTAGLPLCILTDFEEFSVYDTTRRPHKNDTAGTARIFNCGFADYEKQFDFICDTFSRTAIEKGSFDSFAKSDKRKKGTESIDRGILELIEAIRCDFAKNISKNNKIGPYELNAAVIKIIDRVIFLRIAEDKEVEPGEALLKAVSGEHGWQKLKQIFKAANERYNSELFKPNRALDELLIEDKTLRDIIQSLYYPECPYEFSVLPVSILGNIYEQFLGRTIRQTETGLIKIEEKPEVRKAGGVYYTPEYIVDYIVRHTVGEKIKGLAPHQIEKLKVLDPACGSGSFLIVAYQCLLDYHLDYYTQPENLKKALKEERIARLVKGGFRLTIPEKQRILKNNIFGVDIDAQAVEVAKFSLLLKLMETENKESTGELFPISHAEGKKDAKILPDLSANIKCGNSLIGKDFLQQQESLFELENEALRKVNPFDWSEAFPEIMQSGGFDAVIGNPPYGYMISDGEQRYFANSYKWQDYQKDLYLLFLERYQSLLKKQGLLGIIISNTWLQSVKLRKIREYLAANYTWLKILHLPEKVFSAVVDTHVLIFKKGFSSSHKEFIVEVRKQNENIYLHSLPVSQIPQNGDPINIVFPAKAQKLFGRILSDSYPLSEICEVYNGVKPFEKGKGVPPQTEKTMREKPFVSEGVRPDSKWMPLLRGSLINRYITLWHNNYWILYGEWLAAPRDKSIFDAPEKIVVRQTGDSIIATLTNDKFIVRNNLHILLPKSKSYDLLFSLGLLNSRLMDFMYTVINPEKGEALAEVKKQHVEQLPVVKLDFANPAQKAQHDKMVSLVEQMLGIQKQLHAAKSESDRSLYQQKAAAIDQQINDLVYTIYALTKEEIETIKKSCLCDDY